MPELPDVESVVRVLRRKLIGRRITRISAVDRSIIRSPAPSLFARRLRGRTIRKVGRRGKYLLVHLEAGYAIIGHLRMTGEFVVVPQSEPIHPHTRLVVGFDGEDLRFVDQRRFGHVDLVPTHALRTFKGLRALGVEPLSSGFTLDRFRSLIQGRRGSLKALLLRQDVIAGIGNIYADETLFQARLLPARQAQSLRPAEVQRLYHAIRDVLRRAVKALSRDHGSPGDLVEVRERGGACPRCHRALRAAAIAGRTAYFCPSCQR